MNFPEKEPEAEHGWAEHRASWPFDIELRKHGFVIQSRPKRGPTIWLLGRLPYTEEEALAVLQEMRKK